MDTIHALEQAVEELSEVIPTVAEHEAHLADRLIRVRGILRDILLYLDSEGSMTPINEVVH